MKTYGLLLRRRFEYSTEYVEAYLVSRENGKDCPYGCSSDGENQYDREVPRNLIGLQLDGLGMYGFVSDFDQPTYIGHEVEYRNVFAIDAPKANRIARTLKRVLKAMHTFEAHEPGDRLVALASALKLSFVVEQVGTNRSGSYADNDWRFMSIFEGRDRFRQLIAEATAEVRQRKGLAA
jgi:hypothetical protein